MAMPLSIRCLISSGFHGRETISPDFMAANSAPLRCISVISSALFSSNLMCRPLPSQHRLDGRAASGGCDFGRLDTNCRIFGWERRKSVLVVSTPSIVKTSRSATPCVSRYHCWQTGWLLVVLMEFPARVLVNTLSNTHESLLNSIHTTEAAAVKEMLLKSLQHHIIFYNFASMPVLDATLVGGSGAGRLGFKFKSFAGSPGPFDGTGGCVGRRCRARSRWISS
ncbi:hypothetical protein B0T17DRAFT_65962 [Bombardia bombarda]|uniref:Uncharacterized protein n=1 Tax=Bombardia bombarda TaxID=252184 RepID=A0AA40CF62_9PEZI|nr:hypothetical protein B0T17DRAFT_65962 [Bombardia bombarda]